MPMSAISKFNCSDVHDEAIGTAAAGVAVSASAIAAASRCI